MQSKSKINKYTEKIINVLSPLVKGGLKPRLYLVNWQNDYWSNGLISNKLKFKVEIRDKNDILFFGTRIAQDNPTEVYIDVDMTTEKYFADKLIDWNYVNDILGYIVFKNPIDEWNESCNQN